MSTDNEGKLAERCLQALSHKAEPRAVDALLERLAASSVRADRAHELLVLQKHVLEQQARLLQQWERIRLARTEWAQEKRQQAHDIEQQWEELRQAKAQLAQDKRQQTRDIEQQREELRQAKVQLAQDKGRLTREKNKWAAQ